MNYNTTKANKVEEFGEILNPVYSLVCGGFDYLDDYYNEIYQDTSREILTAIYEETITDILRAPDKWEAFKVAHIDLRDAFDNAKGKAVKFLENLQHIDEEEFPNLYNKTLKSWLTWRALSSVFEMSLNKLLGVVVSEEQ
jgi:hypothetical protein